MNPILLSVIVCTATLLVVWLGSQLMERHREAQRSKAIFRAIAAQVWQRIVADRGMECDCDECRQARRDLDSIHRSVSEMMKESKENND